MTLLRLPPEVQKRSSYAARRPVMRLMRAGKLSTVCEEARCPNIGECFSNNTATFMIMGDRCTRRCKFCAVTTKKPLALDQNEPLNLAQTALAMGLDFVVITSVDRDDLPDFGVSHFLLVINSVHELLPKARIELLTPDFKGNLDLVSRLLDSPIDVFGHNIESPRRLYQKLRPQSSFETSALVLGHAARSKICVKSGMMVGVGESDEEVYQTLDLLRELGVSIVTIGQYLRPSLKHWPVARYVSDETFRAFADYGHSIGLKHVFSGPLVRSSYHAKKAHHASVN